MRLVIFGSGPVAELADFYFTDDTPHEVVGFTVDDSHRTADSFRGRPLVGFETVAQRFPPGDYGMFVAVSYSGLNKLRRAKLDAARAMGYPIATYVSSRATRFRGFTPAENQFILEDNTLQPFASVAANVTLWSGNHIGHHAIIEEDCFISSHVVVSGGVRIGPRCFIGVNATVRDHVTIGADCIVGAGALVLADLPAGAVVPAAGTTVSKVPSHRVRRI
jgi:sugar O-acyltransferase (sialic acid O-acetyltransferase NeuD family)